MSKETSGGGAGLHLEWSPERVHAVDVASGRRRSAATIGELSSFIGGHKNVLVGVNRQLIFLKIVSLPRAAAEDLRRILTIQMAQHFPLPSDQLAFDFYQTNVRLEDGLETVVAAIRAEDLKQLTTELQAAGIKATRVLPVALGSAAVAAHSSRASALVIESTPGVGKTIDVVSDGIVKLSRTVLDAANLEREVQRTIAASGAIDPSLIVASPAGSDVESGTTRLPGAIASPKTALDLLHEAPPFHLELAEQRELDHRLRIATHNRLATLLLVSALCLVGLVWKQRSDDAAQVTKGQGKWAQVLNKQKSISDTYTKQAQEATTIATTLKSAFQVAQPLGDVSSVVGDSLPKSSWLSSLNVERGKVVQMRGTSKNPDDVSLLLKNLTSTGRFRDVHLTVANSGKVSSVPVVQFSISAFPIGNLPMPVPAVKRAGSSSRTASATGGGATTTGGTSAADAGAEVKS